MNVDRPRALVAPDARAPGDRPPVTVVYIEDDASTIRLVQRVVATRPRTELHVATRGRRGVEIAREHAPSLILLDLHLPDMPGADVLRELRHDERTATTPVFVLSGDATPGRAEQALLDGATGFIAKPFELATLLALIDRYAEPPDDGTLHASTPIVLEPTVVSALRELGAMSSDGGAQLDELLRVFVADTRARLDELAGAVRRGDADRASRIAHSLGGSTANFGARELAAACREIERTADHGGLPDAAAVSRLDRLFSAAAASLRVELGVSHELAGG